MASAEARAPAGSGSAQELHPTLKKDLFQVNADLYTAVSLWLRKHGKGVKPKLSDEQKQQMKECFELMDQDGSGAIDAEELGAAFKLLGIRMKRAELEKLLAEVDHDGSGEVEYPEFLEIMTVTLQRLAEEDDTDKNEGQDKSGPSELNKGMVPFGLMATAYRRKRLMEGIINGHKEVQAQIQQISDKANLEALQATKAAEMEAMRAKGGDGSGSSSGGGASSSPGRAVSGRHLRRLGQTDVNRALLDTLNPDERRIVNALAAKSPPPPHHAPGRIGGGGGPQLAAAAAAAAVSRPYTHFTNSPSHRQLIDTPQLLDLRFVHSSTIRLPPGAGGFMRSLSGALTGGQGLNMGSGGGGGGGGGSHSMYGGGAAASVAGDRNRDSLNGVAVPPIASPNGMRRSTSNLRVGTPQLVTAGSSGGGASAPPPSPGRASRAEEGGLPQLRSDGGSLPHPAAKQLGMRLGLQSARHERPLRGS